MKISLSFSSSPSSVSSSSCSTTTTASSVFDRNLCNSHNDTAGCLSGVLRRLLCAGSLRTHPFDWIKEANGVDSGTQKKDLNKVIITEENLKSASMTPGLVARLMGLESMPDSNSNAARRWDSIGRSRSVNSADYWSEFDPTQVQHRRVKSFREMPTFLQSENDEFFILSFEKSGESKEFRSNRRRSEMGREESKNERRKKDDRRDRRVDHKCETKISDGSPCFRETHVELKTKSPVKKELPSERSKLEKTTTKKMKSTKKQSIVCAEKNVRTDCDSENSSPVSVLDLDDFLSKTETIESDDKPRLANSNSRRDLSLDLAKSENPSSNFADSSMISEEIEEPRRQIIKNKKQLQLSDGVEGKKEKSHDDHNNKNHLELWGEICRLAEEEILNSSWVTRAMWRIEEFQEIEIDFAVEILDKLVNEVASEMIKFQ